MRFFTLTSGRAELTVERSRFLAFAQGIADEAQAEAALLALKKKYYDATHVCYAYVAGDAGQVYRLGDDGEPSGTAGAPIYAAIRQAELKKTLVAVVRYFGGVKLGTGGLSRAYGQAAKSAIENAGRKQLSLCDVYRVTADHATFAKCEKAISALCLKPLKPVYGTQATAECRTADAQFADKVYALTLGRAQTEFIEKDYEEI